MTSRRKKIVVAGAVAVAAGVAIAMAPAALSQQSSKRQAMDAATDPAANLPTAQRDAAYQAQLDAHMRARADWIRSFEASGRSVDGLERRELNVSSVEPPASLPVALGAAARVVRAQVADLTFTPGGTVATMRVLDAVKPAAGGANEIRVLVGGGPEPDASFGTGYLGIDPAVPFLTPGTNAFLFLEEEPATSAAALSIQAFTGAYVVDGQGRVHAHPGNPFGASVDGLDVAAFRRLLR